MKFAIYNDNADLFEKDFEVNQMSEATINRVAKRFGMKPACIRDTVRDMEGDGIEVTEQDLIDMICNGDI